MIKKVLFVLIAVSFLTNVVALSQEKCEMPLNPDNNTLLYFGNSSYMLCVDFHEAADSSSCMKRMMEIYHLKEIDPDNRDSEYFPYTAFTNAYPFFVVLDKDGAIINMHKGFGDEDEFREFLLASDKSSAVCSYQEVLDYYDKKMKAQRKNQRYLDMVSSGRYYDVSVGYLNSWLTSGTPFRSVDFDGYCLDVDFRQHISRNCCLFAGLGLNRLKGMLSNDILKEYNLSLPIGTEIYLGRCPWEFFSDISVRLGAWGSVNVKSVDIPFYQKWNAGALAELVVQSGSFDVHVGYTRGFISKLTDPSHNLYSNMLTFGVRLRYGN